MWDDLFSPEPTMQPTGMENQMMQQQDMMDMQSMQLAQQQQMMLQQQMMQQQMMQQQMMQQQMMQPQMGYPMQNGYGMPMIRYSKGQLIQGLRDYVVMQSQKTIMREEKLEETPNILRHACCETESKISYLGVNQFNVPEVGVSIPFYFCTACGKLFYPKEIIM